MKDIRFGELRIGDVAREKIKKALDSNWISEGDNVKEFEQKFAQRFGWKHAIATSSGTDAGIVVWSAIREFQGLHHYAESAGHPADCKGHVITPACAFTATANCILAAGMRPAFVDIDLDTLNVNLAGIQKMIDDYQFLRLPLAGIQFVATMGRPTPIREVALLAKAHDLYSVADFCEAHGAGFIIDDTPAGGPPRSFTRHQYADHFADAAIYSFYAAHLVVAGEGGMVCTDDDDIAALCRSIKSHGRRNADIYFHFDRVGYNAKMNELTAAIGIEGLEKFDTSFEKRRALRMNMVGLIEEINLERGPTFLPQEDFEFEIIAPHAYPLVLADPDGDISPLYRYLEEHGIQCKTLFGSLPTDHRAFEFLGYRKGDFPVAERIGRTGLHFGCHEFLTINDVEYIRDTLRNFFK